jgi:hypothetical protein
MKLPKVTSNDPAERVTIPLKLSTRNSLAAYQEHYQKAYGDEITQNHLIESMLVEYMKEDKAFQKVVDKQAKAGKAAGGSGD